MAMTTTAVLASTAKPSWNARLRMGSPPGTNDEQCDPAQRPDRHRDAVRARARRHAGTPVTLHVAYNKAMTAGQSYVGELLLGPPAAPTAMTVAVQISRTP